MARRSGQCGYIERKGNWYHVRFRMDVAGQQARAYKSVALCPVNGPSALTKPERERRKKEIVAASGANSVEHFEKVEAFNWGMTFRQQSSAWLQYAENRQRKPIKPATASSYRGYLNKWLIPLFGDLPLSQVDNKAVKGLVQKLTAAGLAPKTVVEIVASVKLVVSSAKNENGDELYPRKWNHEFIDLPIVKLREQKTPSVETEQLQRVIKQATGRYQMLYQLLAGTGLRIGEALAIRVEDYSTDHTTIAPDCKTIYVRKSVWRGREQEPKTENAVRDVEVPASLAAILKQFIEERTSGFLFQTKTGRPLSQRNILRDSLHELGIRGFHCFRRFRITHLRLQSVPEDILRFWVGQAKVSVTDRYSKMAEHIQLRKEWAEKAGLGFEVAPIAPNTVAVRSLEYAA